MTVDDIFVSNRDMHRDLDISTNILYRRDQRSIDSDKNTFMKGKTLFQARLVENSWSSPMGIVIKQPKKAPFDSNEIKD
mgnify:CR=1 FL=1